MQTSWRNGLAGFLVNRTGIAQERLQQIFQRAASAQDARLNGADAAFQNFGDFFVAQTFQVAQNHRAAKNFGHLREGGLYGALNFARGELIEGSRASVFDFERRVTFVWFGVNRNVLLQVTLEPAAIVERFANRNAIEPGLERAAAAKLSDPFEGLEKDFL